MRSHRLKRLGLLAGIIVLTFGVALTLSRSSGEPTHKGRPLSYWFHELPPTIINGTVPATAEMMSVGGRDYGAKHEKPSASIAAVRDMSPRALPFLIRKLQRRQTKAMTRIEKCASMCGAKQSFFLNPDMERAQAVTALLAIEPLPPESILQLRKLTNSRTNIAAPLADYILAATTNKSLRVTITRYL
jgi:hypothetical protein